jgi:putative chitinase
MKMELSAVPAFLETQEGAAQSAGWFWDANSLNALADASRFTDITKRINGGTNGLADRKEIWARARAAL